MTLSPRTSRETPSGMSPPLWSHLETASVSSDSESSLTTFADIEACQWNKDYVNCGTANLLKSLSSLTRYPDDEVSFVSRATHERKFHSRDNYSFSDLEFDSMSLNSARVGRMVSFASRKSGQKEKSPAVHCKENFLVKFLCSSFRRYYQEDEVSFVSRGSYSKLVETVGDSDTGPITHYDNSGNTVTYTVAVGSYNKGGSVLLDTRSVNTNALHNANTDSSSSTRQRDTAVPKCLQQYFEWTCDRTPDAVALRCGDVELTYAELDKRANKLAHFLRSTHAVQTGARACILLQRSIDTYTTLLAVLKCGAAFVPLDPSYPIDRVLFAIEDSEATVMITTSPSYTKMIDHEQCSVLFLDKCTDSIAQQPETRPELDDSEDSLCYIIYTSGTTGRPKGVGIHHSNICNFISVITPIYEIIPTDRVYQGMSIAFDFSIEEIWPTFTVGATLVAGPTDHRRLGSDLADFLHEEHITVLYCVPTLLSTIDHDLPSLRMINVGGEACSEELVKRWWKPERVMLNSYGPTETTVTASIAKLVPNRKVTIGKPLPTYTMYILDKNLQQIPNGEIGEIYIGGKGVAQGYIKRPEKTASAFFRDHLSQNQDEPGRLYRTGDLGRVTDNGEIECAGRIDDQVKIRGHRIELGEIEAVIRENNDVRDAVIRPVMIGSVQELVAFITIRHATTHCDDRKAETDKNISKVKVELYIELRRRMPVYMVPAFIEVLDAIPTLPSGKADCKKLPTPKSKRLSLDAGTVMPPETALEKDITNVWSLVFGMQNISVEADFFMDMGGHSMAAATVASRLRENPELQNVSLSDIYSYPTIRSLASYLESLNDEKSLEGGEISSRKKILQADHIRHSSVRVWLCGIIQFAFGYATSFLFAIPFAYLLDRGDHPMVALTLVGAAAFPILLILPVLAKWVLIGRYRPGRYPLWGWYYLRFWIVRRLMAVNPILPFLQGSPLLAPYLRLLGASIGRGCHLGSGRIQLPDLIDIGDHVNIGYGVALETYVVRGGWLYLGNIKVGNNSYIGNNSVLMLGSQVGSSAAILEQTLVAENQLIPDHETWAGSPSRSVPPDPVLTELTAKDNSMPSEWSKSLLISFFLFLVLFFMSILPTMMFGPPIYFLWYMSDNGDLIQMIILAPPAGLIFVLSACFSIALSKRIILHKTPEGIHPQRSWLGLRKWASDNLMTTSLAMTNSLYATLYAIPWLRVLGSKIEARAEVSTVSHIDPDLLVLGKESFVADIAAVGSARYHAGCIFTDTTVVGKRSFVGNAALVPPSTRLGDNTLIGVLSVPPQTVVDPGTSWLGSPAIYLPRRQQSQSFDAGVTYRPSWRLVTIRLFIEFFRVTMPSVLLITFWLVAVLDSAYLFDEYRQNEHRAIPVWAAAAAIPGIFLASMIAMYLVIVMLKWIIIGGYRPHVAPLWSHFVWRSEFITALYESAAVTGLIGGFQGTPFIGPLLRLLGSRIGSRVYLETTYVTEFDLVFLGDDVAVGGTCSLQTHLFEDRVMKMSTIRVDNMASIGPRAVVLYDSHVENGVTLDALSLVMKGETIPANRQWRGIPAQIVSRS